MLSDYPHLLKLAHRAAPSDLTLGVQVIRDLIIREFERIERIGDGVVKWSDYRRTSRKGDPLAISGGARREIFHLWQASTPQGECTHLGTITLDGVQVDVVSDDLSPRVWLWVGGYWLPQLSPATLETYQDDTANVVIADTYWPVEFG